ADLAAQNKNPLDFALIGTPDAAMMRIYINGELKNSVPFSASYNPSSAGVRAGGEVCCGGNNFPGIIDEAKIWSLALSPEQVKNNISHQLVGNESGLTGYWRFDERSGTTTADLSGNNHTGLLGGTSSASPSTPAWP